MPAPAYAGDIAHGDVYVEDAHDPLIDRETWKRASSIAAERADPQTQRAASSSDYDLTGKITCPGCGHKYIGTSATGRSRTYRYYTCFSRVRYGTHGCAPRSAKPPSKPSSPRSASPRKESSPCSQSQDHTAPSPEKPAQPAPAPSRFAQWFDRWGAWGSNPEPTD
jgi:Recombinase zinc beta ribbon domain